jgi:hypothetical protein
METRCISCGMPMVRPEEFPLGDMSKNYCVHCSRPDGSMKNYEEQVAGFTAFMVRTQGLDPAAARAQAIEVMRNLPAWRDHR